VSRVFRRCLTAGLLATVLLTGASCCTTIFTVTASKIAFHLASKTPEALKTVAPGELITVGRLNGNKVTSHYCGLARRCAAAAGGDSVEAVLMEMDRDTTAIPLLNVTWVMKQRPILPVFLAFVAGVVADARLIRWFGKWPGPLD
jgi:hypothetical protein